jgi:hypothetical protein
MSKVESDCQILCRLYFRTVPHPKPSKAAQGKIAIFNNENGEAQCISCNETVKNNCRHENLERHIHVNHKDWRQTLDNYKRGSFGAMDRFVQVHKIVSDKAKGIFGWIEWIVMADLPITIVDNPIYRKRSNLPPTNYKTITKYMEKLLEIVQRNIKRDLPPTFGIIFDGWTCDSEHYIGVFATWSRNDGSVVKRLIACGVQDLPETEEAKKSFGFAAEDIGDYLFDVLALYDRDFTSVEFASGDNAYVNGKLMKLMSDWIWDKKRLQRKIPLVGCSAHRLHLAVQFLLSENSDWNRVIQKVHTLMVDLRSIKNRPKLAVVTALAPVIRQDTRWNSTYAMLVRYIKLCEETDHFKKCIGLSAKTMNLVLTFTGRENEYSVVCFIKRTLEKFYEVSQYLQSEDMTNVTMSKTRFYFNELLKKHPELHRYLSEEGENVSDPYFEKAIVKIQNAVIQGLGKVKLDPQEARAVHIYLKEDLAGFDSSDESESENETSFIKEADAQYEAKVKRNKKEFPYRSTMHVCATSVIVERLFSRCGIIMRPHRRLMDPSTMEMLVMLRFNRDLWDEVLVDAAIKEAEPVKVATPSQPSQLIARSSSPQGPQIHDVNDSA